MATTKKTTETKAVPKKAASSTKTDAPNKTAASKKSAQSVSVNEISLGERYRMIEVAAYYIAEKNNFSGNAAEYWVLAEREISAKYPK